jgi:hypothetical protein
VGDELFSKGDLVVMTSGCYSDFGITGLVRALRDFTIGDIKGLAGAYRPDKYSGHRISLQVLVDAGWVEELPSRELWCGDS